MPPKTGQATCYSCGRFICSQHPKSEWPRLCQRIDALLKGQTSLINEAPATVETEAQRVAAQRLTRGRVSAANTPVQTPAAPIAVNLDSLALTRPRSVGVEQVGL